MQELVLNDIYYSYRSKYRTIYALNGVNASFRPGCFYAIVGKSGSGKSTLLSMIAGLDLPTKGEVLFDGRSTSHMNLDRYRMNSVAMIYQDYNLFPLLTVIENVMYPLLLKNVKEKEARKIAEEKIHSIGLDDRFFRRYPSMLSGGEQQRIAIARALAGNAEVLLADEATGNLDTENSMNIINLLRKLVKDANICVVFVTHDKLIADMADIVLNLSDGKILL